VTTLRCSASAWRARSAREVLQPRPAPLLSRLSTHASTQTPVGTWACLRTPSLVPRTPGALALMPTLRFHGCLGVASDAAHTAGARLASKRAKDIGALGDFIVGDNGDESCASSSASGSGDEAGASAGAPTGLDWASGDVRERIRALVQQKGAARPLAPPQPSSMPCCRVRVNPP